MHSSPNMTINTYELLCLFNCVSQIKIKVLFSTSSDILGVFLICIQQILVAHLPDIKRKNSNKLFGQPNTMLSKTSDLHLLKIYYSTEFGE